MFQRTHVYRSFPPVTRSTINLIVILALTGLIEAFDLFFQMTNSPNHLNAGQMVEIAFTGALLAILHTGITYFSSTNTLEVQTILKAVDQEVQKVEKQVEDDANKGKPLGS